MIRHGHGFGETLGLIVNAARTDRVDVAPVILLLRMHQRIAVTFGGRRQNEGRLLVLGQAERVVRSEGADLESRNRQLQVIDRAGRRREMEDVIEILFRQ